MTRLSDQAHNKSHNPDLVTAPSAARIHPGGEFHWVGDGFPVRSVFGYNDLGQELSPFLLLDHAAPYYFDPTTNRRGVGAHPHRGFETVTVVYQGELEHRDSSGGGGKIGPGDVQWMTAASGLVHEEFHSSDFTRSGGVFEVVQLWVNLPAIHKSAQPGYQTILRKDIPAITLTSDLTVDSAADETETIGQLGVIAGEYRGNQESITGPAKTFTPICLWDLQLTAGASLTLPLPGGYTKAALVLGGEIQGAKVGELLIFDRSQANATIIASTAARALILAGEPIQEPIVGYGPFVMNTEVEIKQAFTDYKMGRLGAL